MLLKPHNSFQFQYRLLTMTTFFEIAVYSTTSLYKIRNIRNRLRDKLIASTGLKTSNHVWSLSKGKRKLIPEAWVERALSQNRLRSIHTDLS